MRTTLFQPIDIAPIVLFRIFIGLFISIEVLTVLYVDQFFNSYIHGEYHFSYLFFPFVKPWGETGMYIHIWLCAIAGIMVSLGLFYRFSSIALFILYNWFFLMEKAEYWNTLYLYCLLSFLLVILPGNKAFSLDVKFKFTEEKTSVPAWTLYIILFHVSAVYFYSGVSKLTIDWLSGRTAGVIFGNVTHLPFLKPILTAPPFYKSIAIIATLFDLFVPFGLLWKKTRSFFFFLVVVFHVFNAIMFGLVTLPFCSILLSGLFYSPEKLRKTLKLNRFIPAYKNHRTAFSMSKVATLVIGFYCLMQVLIPLRHWLYPGFVNWTDAGHNFSWHLMARRKSATLYYVVKSPSQQKMWEEFPSERLSSGPAFDMSFKPDMILQYALFLKTTYKKMGYDDVEVYAESMVSLNGRPYQQYIDNTVDLGKEKRTLCAYDWILPFEKK